MIDTSAPHVAEKAVNLMKALSNENRLLIIALLCDGERSVTELEVALNIRQPTLSQQLARLRSYGLVSTRRDGKSIYYSLANEDAMKALELVRDLYQDGDARAA